MEVGEESAGSPCPLAPSGAGQLCSSGCPAGRREDGTGAAPVTVHSLQDVCQPSLELTGHATVAIPDHSEREVLSDPACGIQIRCFNDQPCSLRRNLWRQRACRSHPVSPVETRRVFFHSVSSLLTDDLFELIVRPQSRRLDNQREDTDANPPVRGDSLEYLELLGPPAAPAGGGREGADSCHPTGQFPAEQGQHPAEREQVPTGHKPSAEQGTISAERGMSPAEGEMIPAEGEMIPAEGEMIPAEGGMIPAEGGMIPAEGEKIPEDRGMIPSAEKIPAEGETIPAEGEYSRAEGERTPAEGERTPAEGERTPAEGERVPAGEDSPAEGEKTPAEVAVEKGAPPTVGERVIPAEVAAAPAGPCPDPGAGKGLGGRKDPDEELYNTILQHQSSRARIEDQRSQPPAYSPRDFFNLLEKLQERRMEEQRAPAPPGLGLKESLSPSRDQRRPSTLGPLLRGMSQRRANSN